MAAPGWFYELLNDPKVTDLCLQGPLAPTFDRGQGMQKLATSEINPGWPENEIKLWVLEQLSACGKSWDARQPYLDFTLDSGHRAHVIFPPLSRQGICLSLRRVSATATVPSIVSAWKSDPLFSALQRAVVLGESILIAGATGSGKTTLLSTLLSEAPVGERIIALEDTPELTPSHPQFLSLQSRSANADGFGEVTLRDLLRQTLRMRPDRLVLGECRGGEVLELLQVLNTGHRGAMATIHAHSPRDALRRLELLCLLAAQGAIPVSVIRDLMSVGLQWIASVVRDSDGHRRIKELAHVEGKEGEVIVLRPLLKTVSHAALDA